MFCNTISVYVLMRGRVSALNVQTVLCAEQDLEVLVLSPEHVTDLQAVADFRPDVVITDAATCSLQSSVELANIKQSGVTKFLFLCSSEAGEASQVLDLGADGVVAKSAPADSLAIAVRSIASGRVWIDENFWRDHLTTTTGTEQDKEDAEIDSASSEPVIASTRLSYREIEVLRLAADGFSNREIAKFMNLTHDTIKCCMWLIVRKLRARGRVHAVSVARQCGMFS